MGSESKSNKSFINSQDDLLKILTEFSRGEFRRSQKLIRTDRSLGANANRSESSAAKKGKDREWAILEAKRKLLVGGGSFDVSYGKLRETIQTN